MNNIVCDCPLCHQVVTEDHSKTYDAYWGWVHTSCLNEIVRVTEEEKKDSE